VFVGCNALVAVFSYLVIVGPIKRVVLKEPPANGSEAPGKLSQAHS
jgi:ACS family glucarate transporter-like MFS transporter